MKITYFALLATVSLMGASSAALYTLTTGTGVNAPGVGNSAGVPFQNSADASLAGPGTVAFGTFTGLSDAQIAAALTPGTLISAFQTFGTAGTFTAPGFTGTRGTFSRAASQTVTGTAFANQPMYVFVGNGLTFADSTEFLVLKTEFTFSPAQDAIPTPETLTISRENTTVLIGTAVPDIRTTAGDTTVTPGWATTILIPEPSTALLGLVGALGLLRRRR